MSKRSPKPRTPGIATPPRGRGGAGDDRVPGSRASPRLRWAFPTVATLSSFAVLGLAELVCRLCGFGGYPPVLVRVGADAGSTWYATSRAGTDTFFYSGRWPTGGMREVQFTTPKPPGTVRIVLLGESAIQGFPQPLPLTDGSFLEAMLRDVWRGKRAVEVLNLGATAVASFPVLCFLDAVLDHAPDLVVLMTGSNEFYGAYGVASLPSAGRSPEGMRVVRRLRELGLSQWLNSLWARRTPPSGTLMERVAGNQQIGPDDPLREAAARNLRTHLVAMVRRCASRKVPVVVCTVPTNERGMAPIGRDIEPSLPAEKAAAFHDELALAEQVVASDPKRAEALARGVIGLSAGSARAHFVLGSALTRLGRHDEALAEYVRARDLDTMPWRATSAATEAVRAAAREGAILCDMEGAFRAASPGGSIGWELVDDHVHMSLQGQFLFAKTLAAAMTSMPEPLHVSREELEPLPGWEVYAERLGHSAYTDYVAATHLGKLFDIPFMRRSNEAAYQRYDDECRSLLAGMSEVDRAAVERWRDPSLHGATDRPLEFVLGRYRMAAGDYETAARLFRFARECVPVASSWRLELVWHLLTCHRHLHDEPTQEDRELCREAMQIGRLLEQFGGAGKPEVLRYLGLVYNLAGDHAAAVGCLEKAVRTASGKDGWEVVQALADSYSQLHRTDDAHRLLDLALQDPDMAEPARRMLRAIEAKRTSP